MPPPALCFVNLILNGDWKGGVETYTNGDGEKTDMDVEYTFLANPNDSTYGDFYVHLSGRHDETLDSGVKLSPDDTASMNMWGFAPSIFPALKRNFEAFLRAAGDNPKAECYLPSVVDAERAAGNLTVHVLKSSAQWFGMTYHEDSAAVAESLRALHASGVYPETLLP